MNKNYENSSQQRMEWKSNLNLTDHIINILERRVACCACRKFSFRFDKSVFFSSIQLLPHGQNFAQSI